MARVKDNELFERMLNRAAEDCGSIKALSEFCGASYNTVLSHLRSLQDNGLSYINTKTLKQYYVYFGEELFDAIVRHKGFSEWGGPNGGPLHPDDAQKALEFDFGDDREEDDVKNILYEMISRLARIEAKIDLIIKEDLPF